MLLVQPIVEGHGEVEAVRVLISRIWYELISSSRSLEILSPWRMPRTRMPSEEHLSKVVRNCALKLSQRATDGVQRLILILADADDDLPCQLGPDLARIATKTRSDIDSTCVIANRMYETWFAASTESLVAQGYLRDDASISEDPESEGIGKTWIKRYFNGSYKETIDQAKLTHALDLGVCRRRAPSFDKLCRELERMDR